MLNIKFLFCNYKNNAIFAMNKSYISDVFD